MPREPVVWGHFAVAAMVGNVVPFFLFGVGEHRADDAGRPIVLSAGQLTAATALSALALPIGWHTPDLRLDALGSVVVLGVLGTGIAYILNYRLYRRWSHRGLHRHVPDPGGRGAIRRCCAWRVAQPAGARWHGRGTRRRQPGPAHRCQSGWPNCCAPPSVLILPNSPAELLSRPGTALLMSSEQGVLCADTGWTALPAHRPARW